MTTPARKRTVDSFMIIALVAQAVLAVLFGIFTSYGDDVVSATQTDVAKNMSMYIDITTMVFIGFGFLMSFMRKHSYGAVIWTFFVSVFVIQWAMLTLGFGERVHDGHWNLNIPLTMKSLIDAMFAAASVMISLGAVIGKVTPASMLVMGFFHIIFYSINVHALVSFLKVYDIGGGMTIHTFGAYFGLTCSLLISRREKEAHHRYAEGVEPTYTSDLFSLLGTVFLWIYWPSFNAVMGLQRLQLMAVIHTLLSLCGATFTTVIVSRFLRGDNKIHLVDVQNATLAGGVAMGCIADSPLNAGVAIACGMGAGLISTLGFNLLMPRLERLGLHDSCGVNNLHGMPGIYSAIISAIAIASFNANGSYGSAYSTVFRLGAAQGGYQMIGLLITLGLAIGGGVLTGVIMRFMYRPTVNEVLSDAPFFHMPSDFVDHPPVEKLSTDAETPAEGGRYAPTEELQSPDTELKTTGSDQEMQTMVSHSETTESTAPATATQ